MHTVRPADLLRTQRSTSPRFAAGILVVDREYLRQAVVTLATVVLGSVRGIQLAVALLSGQYCSIYLGSFLSPFCSPEFPDENDRIVLSPTIVVR